jgi:serine protease AprX
VTLTVNSAADFSLSDSPTSLSISRGTSGKDTVTVTALQGFTGAVSLKVNGLPSRTSAAWSSTTVSGSGSVTLTIHAGSHAHTGTYTLTITGTSGGHVHSIPLTLVVK